MTARCRGLIKLGYWRSDIPEPCPEGHITSFHILGISPAGIARVMSGPTLYDGDLEGRLIPEPTRATRTHGSLESNANDACSVEGHEVICVSNVISR
jgi:hypothetical protein